VSEFDAEVRRQNLTPAEGLKRLEDNSDPLARERGEDMGKAIARAARLNEQIQALNAAGPLVRLYVVATSFDPEIARSALYNYEPAEPLSVGALTAGGLADAPYRLALQPSLPSSRGARVNRRSERRPRFT
jgi:hypothetical protein